MGDGMKAILLTAYGSPSNLDDVERYYTHIRGGRKPTEQQLNELVEKYRRIGGSPLLQITFSQAKALEAMIKSKGTDVKVYFGMKHSHPFISEVMEDVKNHGIDSLLVIPLAPHYSRLSTEGYIKAVEDSKGSVNTHYVKSWHNQPEFIDAWANNILRFKGDFHLLYSAHSLPERIINEGDPYRQELLETCSLINSKVNPRRWSFAFQSAGRTDEKWLGPDILEHLESLYNLGERNFLVAPIGFVSDHLEVLYDIDVECVEWAKRKGVELKRCPSFNDSHEFIYCLYSIAKNYGYA
ncbi:MAG: ferrochelatase [Nitrososphaerota archaeon]